jgi:UDP-N-acetyl-D-glucosamine dehydrogenase
MKNNLIDKLNNKDAKVAVIGLGYVGLPLVLRFVERGYRVVGIDVDSSKVAMLSKGLSYFSHISSERVRSMAYSSFQATTKIEVVSEVDAVIICLPTPLNKHREPDLSFVTDTVDRLIPHLKKEQILSLESTTYPGTTEEEVLPRLQKSGLIVGVDLFLVYSPEREDPGNESYKTGTIPKVVGGHTNSCLEVGKALYGSVIDQVVPVSSTKVAEMTKLLENIYRAVNIGLVNEMKVVADRMGININEVIRAAATKPFGFNSFYPGPGLGGHCIPIDPFYLTWKAKSYGLNTRFIELAGEVNTNMPHWVVGKTVDAVNAAGKSIKGSRLLVLGIAYKKDIDDMRESPAVKIMDLLTQKAAVVDYSDPLVPAFPKMRDYDFELQSVELTSDAVNSYDALIVVTDHSRFDYDFLLRNAKLIIDTRGVYEEAHPNVVKA